MKAKNMTMKVSATALAVLLGAGSALNAASFLNVAPVVHAQGEKQESSTTVINESTVWKYLDDNTDPAAGLS